MFYLFYSGGCLFALHSSLFCASDDSQQFCVGVFLFFTFICVHLTVLFLGRSKIKSFASKRGLNFSLLYRRCFVFKI